MKIYVCIAFTLISLMGRTQPLVTTNPDSININVSDVVNFWSAYDQLAKATSYPDSVRVIDQAYLQKGTRGLKLYQRLSSSTPDDFLAAIRNHPKLLQSIRVTSLSIPTYRKSIIAGAKKLKQLYSASVFPELFFCMGKFEVAGNRTGDVLYIGAELNTLTAKTPREELTNPYVRAGAGTVDRVEAVCLHEIAHYQQKLDPKTNLELALVEGGAEFVTRFITGKSTMQSVFDQLTPELEKSIRQEFAVEMNKPIDANWFLATGDSSRDRPGMLGYVIGYRICEAYYEKARNKDEALRSIITLADYKEIYSSSGYGN